MQIPPGAVSGHAICAITMDVHAHADVVLGTMRELDGLTPDVPREKKIEGLEGRYNVPVKGDVAEGVNVMCDLSGYVEEKAVSKKMIELVLANLKQSRKPEEFVGYLGLTVDQVKDIEQKVLALA